MAHSRNANKLVEKTSDRKEAAVMALMHTAANRSTQELLRASLRTKLVSGCKNFTQTAQTVSSLDSARVLC